jgi:hypothetical protein
MTRRPFSKKTESIEVRVAPEMKQSFVARCEKDRRSASEVLRHLMLDYASAEGRVSKPATGEFGMFSLLSNRFVRSGMVLGAIMSLGVVSSPSTAADPRLTALFHWFDDDGDGALTSHELFPKAERPPASLAGAEVNLTTNDGHAPGETAQDLFTQVDVNGDGRITLAEMAEKAGVDSRVGASLLDADEDGSNSVTAAELAARITEARAEAGLHRPATGAALMAVGLLAAHDLNEDGQLTTDELAG